MKDEWLNVPSRANWRSVDKSGEVRYWEKKPSVYGSGFIVVSGRWWANLKREPLNKYQKAH